MSQEPGIGPSVFTASFVPLNKYLEAAFPGEWIRGGVFPIQVVSNSLYST